MKNTLIGILLLIATMSVAAQNVTYVYDNAGNRTARTVTVQAKLSQTIETQQVVTDIPEVITQKDFLVYPNPTQGHFSVEIGNLPHDTKGEAYLFDAKGRILEKKSIHSHSMHKKLDFNITHQAAGMYILNVRIGESTFTWKIIKK